MELVKRRTSAPNEKFVVTLAPYVAGFFDGEGCIRIARGRTRGSYHLRLSVTNTNLAILTALRDEFGGSLLSHGPQQRSNHQPSWSWVLSTVGAESLLRWMQPYLVVKREQCDLALEFLFVRDKNTWRATPDELELREFYRTRLKELKRGA